MENRTAIYEPGFVVSFIPSPDFNRSDADINLSFLSVNSVKFVEPVDDPLFSAHQPYIFPRGDSNKTFYTPENKTYFTSDNLANLIGCTEQHQFRNPNLPLHIGCTPLAGLYEVGKSLDSLSTNPVQAATAALMFNILSFWQVGLFMLAETCRPFSAARIASPRSLLPTTSQQPMDHRVTSLAFNRNGFHASAAGRPSPRAHKPQRQEMDRTSE